MKQSMLHEIVGILITAGRYDLVAHIVIAKPISQEDIEIKDEDELKRLLLDKSKVRGAWVYRVLPFSHTTTLFQYRSPSSIPLEFIDATEKLSRLLHMEDRGVIAYRGKFIPFSKTKLVTEQNRGLGRE